jgi:ABC-type nitrate/sulfonate/bicarbonate transport system substrate-binding protein
MRPESGKEESMIFRRSYSMSGAAMLTLTLAALTVLSGCGGDESASSDLDTVRVGWQTPWATQGQVAQTLAHTDILRTNGLQARFSGFLSGAPLNEAALAGSVDVFFTADQPAATLLARRPDFVVLGRLMNNRVCLYVPPDSPVRTVADLRGKTVGMPFGAAAQRKALEAMIAAGLDPDHDVKSVNMDITEQTAVVGAGTRSDWGKIDALAGFDPTAAIFEAAGTARMLNCSNVVAVVVASRRFVEQRQAAASAFLTAYVQAWHYYATHQAQADQWFAAASGLKLTSDEPLKISAAVEPNVSTKTVQQLKVTLDDGDLRVFQQAADFIADRKLVPTRVTVRDHVDQKLMTEAVAAATTTSIDVHPVS